MSAPPGDRVEFLIRFVCAALFSGMVIGLIGVRFVDSVHPSHMVAWCLLTIGLGLLAGLRGDDVWRWFFRFFRWW